MNKMPILPSWQIDSNESEPKSPSSKRHRLTYEEKEIFLCLKNELQYSVLLQIYLRVIYVNVFMNDDFLYLLFSLT